MCEIFSNFNVVLRIILTLTVTVASGERSLFKLKLIKKISPNNDDIESFG